MSIGTLVAKFFIGGALVCAFALVSEVFKPKRFAGLFSGAPSVLTAGLAVTLIAESVTKAALSASGAAVGAVGLVAYCLVAPRSIRRFKPLVGSALVVLVWLAVAIALYAIVAKVAGW